MSSVSNEWFKFVTNLPTGSERADKTGASAERLKYVIACIDIVS